VSKRTDTDDERFARIEALMEEYRVLHEDLVDYVREFEQRSRVSQRESRAAVSEARERFALSKTRSK